ncbi:hypothetical protein HY484_00265, partial [Candidatus Woesearchaeota archaeon]|nr:hypothetical protein [Candidatus Woesearchaeota archaeon]
RHPEAMAGSNLSMLVVAENYNEAKAKVIASDPEYEYKFFDNFSSGKPKLFSQCCSDESLQECYEVDKVSGLEIRVVEND